MAEPTAKQKQIIESDRKKILVNCSAASGKTFCLIERLRFLINKYPDSKIVAITFTNAAAEEIKNRLDVIPQNTFIGTIHSYCNSLLLMNGIITKQVIEEQDFDKLFLLYKQYNIYHEVDYLLLDEGQDSTKLEYDFLLNDLNPKNWTIFADRRQSIYGFRGAFPENLSRLAAEPDVTLYPLSENFRNGEKILAYASSLMNYSIMPYSYRDNSICCSGREGQVFKVTLDYDWMKQEILSHDNFKDWFILTRDNQQLARVKFELERRQIPCSTFRQANLTNKDLSDIINSNTVKVLTIHSSKGLEANNVMVYGALFRTREELCCSYVAATRAKDRLYMLSAPKKKKSKNTIVNWE